jgi:hypothetical protein
MCQIPQRYYINIGEANVLDENGDFKKVPATQVEIGEETHNFIQQFADVSITDGLTKQYKINNIEFTITPKFEMDER